MVLATVGGPSGGQTPRHDPAWPQYRGPRGDSVSFESGLADSWPAEGPPVLWVRPLGQGYSGFAAVGGRLFTQTQNVLGQYVVCLDAATGDTIWEYRYDLPFEPAGLYPGPRSTPAWADGKVYVISPDLVVGCLDEDGRLIWKLDLQDRFHGRGTDFGYSASPVIVGGLLLLPVGGTGASLVALDRADGSVVWAAGDDPASYSTLLPIHLEDRALVVGLLQNGLVVHDLKSGELLFRVPLSHGYDEHSAAPVYVEPYVFVSGPFRSGADLYRLGWIRNRTQDVDPASKVTLRADPVWFSPNLLNDVASSLHWQGHLFGFDLTEPQARVHRPSRGEFRCLELAAGKTVWSSDQTGQCSVLAVDGKLILFNDKGELTLCRARADRFEELARTTLFGGQICWTAPALANKRLFLRTQSTAACLYLGRPDELATDERHRSLTVSEIPQSSSTSWLIAVGKEREYPFDPPTREELWHGYLGSIGVFAVSSVLALTVTVVINRLNRPKVPLDWTLAPLWGAVLLLGAAATPFLNRLDAGFWFTWPASLYAASHATALTLSRRASSTRRRDGWLTRLAALAFISVCFAYFWICRQVSLHHHWAFLVLFIPAFPLFLLTQWITRRTGSKAVHAVAGACSFGGAYLAVGVWLRLRA
jgi:hypothetical protein